MAKQLLNTGVSANDRTGDTLRSGALKINSNFTELYQSNDSVFDRLTAGSHIVLSKTGNTCSISAVITPYTLPTSSTNTLGGVKVDGSTITISNGVISSAPQYTLPISSTNTLGGVKVDGSTITINSSGVISSASAYTLPTATTSSLGGVKVDGTSVTIVNGVISSNAQYTLPTASTTVLGGVKVDNATITIDGNGVIRSLSIYLLPTASTTVLGGVKVDGDSITISNNGVISAASAYNLPTASTIELGGVKIDGNSITINEDGIISTSIYTLPPASDMVLGGVKVDNTSITINDGVITSNLKTRGTYAATTLSIANDESADLTIVGFKGYCMYSIQTSAAAWVVVYTSTAARTSDSTRSITTDPTPGSGVIAEVITTAAQTQTFSPAVFGFTADSSTSIRVKVVNKSGTTQAITVTLTLLQLEA